MLCPHCQRALPNGSTFCLYCGAQFTTDEPDATQVNQHLDEQEHPQEPDYEEPAQETVYQEPTYHESSYHESEPEQPKQEQQPEPAQQPAQQPHRVIHQQGYKQPRYQADYFHERKAKPKNNNALIIGVAIVLAALIIGGVLLYLNGCDRDKSTADESTPIEQTAGNPAVNDPAEPISNTEDEAASQPAPTTETAQPATPAVVGKSVVTVSGTNVRLRTAPQIADGNILATPEGKPIYPQKGENLVYQGDAGDFYCVKYKGNTVYISKKFAKLQP